MQSFTIQEARDKLSILIDDVVQGHLPIAISSDRNDAVLISKADWDAIGRNTLSQSNSKFS